MGAALPCCGRPERWVLYVGRIIQVLLEREIMDIVAILLAGFGAGLLITALAFVTALIGVLVNAMITLYSGPVIDGLLSRRSPG